MVICDGTMAQILGELRATVENLPREIQTLSNLVAVRNLVDLLLLGLSADKPTYNRMMLNVLAELGDGLQVRCDAWQRVEITPPTPQQE